MLLPELFKAVPQMLMAQRWLGQHAGPKENRFRRQVHQMLILHPQKKHSKMPPRKVEI
jgi:hypothetical protein